MKKDNPKKLASPLYQARKAAGLSMPMLAKMANTSAQQIDRLELDQRSMSKDWAERLAPHLDLDPVALLFPDSAGSPNSAVPVDEVRIALETFGHMTGMHDTTAREAADLLLEEMLAPKSPVLDQRTSELRVAFDRIIRRYVP